MQAQILLILSFIVLAIATSNYAIGVGIYDITGPAAETGMMGYAMPGQTTEGVHFRLRARSFVLEDLTSQNSSQSRFVAFVSTDSCMIYTSVKTEVTKRLQARYGANVYSEANVMLSGTHTHSGPGGYSQYMLYDITTLGFHTKNWETIVSGIYNAIVAAHESRRPGKMLVNVGELLDSNINRSPSAYANNPEAEKARYPYNVDKNMTVLRFEDIAGNEIGMFSWFAVHGTSMQNTNHYISGDNKGYAAYYVEKLKNPSGTLPGFGKYVAGFGQSNEGDVSPNTKGAFCNNGMPCEYAHSTCGGYSENCHGYGPGDDMFESTKIIGTNQAAMAMQLSNAARTEVQAGLSHVHSFKWMYNNTVLLANGTTVPTCVAALGDGFAAGTTDGPGMFDFTQGTNSTSTNPYWNWIASFLSDPTPAQRACQYPKPILLNTGAINFPSIWTPQILPLQIFKIGQFVLIGVPGEFSTMSGRRLRETVRQTLQANGNTQDLVVVIAGLSNAYSQYITTNEEYHVQRYEGASTLYGPFTLNFYQQEYAKLAKALQTRSPVDPGPTPPWLKTYSLEPGVIVDVGDFGKVYKDVRASYSIGDTVEVVFYGANPRNDFRTQSTFLTVERQNSTSGNWTVVLTDGHWETKYHWARHDIAESLITIQWDITAEYALPGLYRIQTFGKSLDIFQKLTPYTGTSSTFRIQ